MTEDAIPMMFQVSCERCGGKPRKYLSAPGHQREEVLEDLQSLMCTGCGSPLTIEQVGIRQAGSLNSTPHSGGESEVRESR